MNGKTIVLNPESSDGHRVKRIKLKGTRAGRPFDIRNNAKSVASLTWIAPRSIHTHDKMDINGVGAERPVHYARGTNPLVMPQLMTVMADLPSTGPVRQGVPTMPRGLTPQTQQRERSLSLDQEELGIDFSSIPSEPTELAWWVAQQASHCQALRPLNLSPSSRVRDIKEGTQASKDALHRPKVVASPQSQDERAKLREENRERKKRWRTSNAERNRDNNLKSRVIQRAKKKFGSLASIERTAYIEAEFNRRKTNRETGQRPNTTPNGGFPDFELAAGALLNHFGAENSGVSPEIKTAGSLLLETLVQRNKGASLKAANALNCAIRDNSLALKYFVEAFKLMAKNHDLMDVITTKLGEVDDDIDYINAVSEDESRDPLTPSPKSQAASASTKSTLEVQLATEAIRALNATTALLNEMADTKTQSYASPYGNPVSTTTTILGTVATNIKTTSQKSVAKTAAKTLDHIDALLALANGGSLTDDEDDKTIADSDELDDQILDLGAMPQGDTNVAFYLHRVLSHLIAERDEKQDDTRPLTDQYSRQTIRDQARKLLALVAQASVSVNIVMPLAQSYALSQFYGQIASRSRSYVPGGSGAQHHEGSHCVPNKNIQDILSKEESIPEHQRRSFPSIEDIPIASRKSISLPSRPSNPEVQKKIKSYGFPPLPGSKLGIKKKEL